MLSYLENVKMGLGLGTLVSPLQSIGQGFREMQASMFLAVLEDLKSISKQLKRLL